MGVRVREGVKGASHGHGPADVVLIGRQKRHLVLHGIHLEAGGGLEVARSRPGRRYRVYLTVSRQKRRRWGRRR